MSKKYRTLLLKVKLVFWICAKIACGMANPKLVEQIAAHSLVSVNLTHRIISTGLEVKRELQLQKELLKQYNTTVGEVERGFLEELTNGTTFMVLPDGRRFIAAQKVVEEKHVDIHRVTISAAQNVNKTMKDILDNPDFDIVKPEGLQWRNPPMSEVVHSLTVIIESNGGEIFINQNKSPIPAPTVKSPLYFSSSEDEGIALTVVNPQTSTVTLQKLFLTCEFGGWRHIGPTLESISNGSIVILSSQFEGSLLLANEARAKIASLGSTWSHFYLFGDVWIFGYIKGGPILIDALISNSFGRNYTSSGVKVNVQIPSTKMRKECPSWPHDTKWRLRWTLCQLNDGLGRLCDCANPFELPRIENTLKTTIPIMILVGTRIHSLVRLLECLGRQRGISGQNILLVQDGFSEDVRKLAEVLELRIISHETYGYGPLRISFNLRFGLYHLLREYPNANQFVVLEDDLLLADDFLEYMAHHAPLLHEDKSVFSVSGLNFLSYPRTSLSASLSMRVNSYPDYGWMMARATLEEVLPKWPPKDYFHDWDHFMGAEWILKGRDNIVPDVNRAYHNKEGNSIHSVSMSFSTEMNYLRHSLNQQQDVRLRPIRKLKKIYYKREFERLLKSASPVQVYDITNITLPKSESGVYVIFAKQEQRDDHSAFKALGQGLGSWTESPLVSVYEYTWKLFYQNHLMFVMGVPISKYSYLQPADVDVFAPHSANWFLNEEAQISRIEPRTHLNTNIHPEDYFKFQQLHTS